MLSIRHVAVDGTLGPVYRLSTHACHMSGVLSTMIQAQVCEADEVPEHMMTSQGDAADETIHEVRAPYATARSLAVAAEFVCSHALSETMTSLPKPLWFDSTAKEVPTTSRTFSSLAEEELALVRMLEGDAELLMEVTKTADFLQVSGLLKLCCGVLAASLWKGDGGSMVHGLELLPPMVLVEVLTYLPAARQHRALSVNEALREEVCYFTVERWFTGLLSRSIADPYARPWLMCPSSIVNDADAPPDDVAVARLMNEVGAFMLEHQLVPGQLTAERLTELLETVLAAINRRADPYARPWLHDADAPPDYVAMARLMNEGQLSAEWQTELLETLLAANKQSADRAEPVLMIGIFSTALTGPLGLWLQHGLTKLGMENLLVSRDEVHLRTWPNFSDDCPVIVLMPPKSISGNSTKRSVVRALNKFDWHHLPQQLRLVVRSDAAMHRVAVWPGGAATFVVAAPLAGAGERRGSVGHTAVAVVVPQSPDVEGLVVDRLDIAGVGQETSLSVRKLTHRSAAEAEGTDSAHARPSALRFDLSASASRVGSASVGVGAYCRAVHIEDLVLEGQSPGHVKSVSLSQCRHVLSIAPHFCSNTGITSVDLGGWAAVTVGDYFFASCPSLTSVSTTAVCGIQCVGSHAFADCKMLARVDLTHCQHLTTVASHFCARSGLTELDTCGWPGVTLGDFMCAECPALTSIVASSASNIECLGAYAFSSCPCLTRVDLSNCRRLASIGSHFCFRSSLTVVDLGDSAVTAIDDYMCSNCPNLSSVTLPNTLQRLGSHALFQCAQLTHVRVVTCGSPLSFGAHFCAESGLRALDMSSFLVVEIGDYMCSNCPNLSSVTLPNTMQRLGSHALHMCPLLTRITLRNCTSLGRVGSHFCSGTALHDLDLTGCVVKEIGSYACGWCPMLTAVTLNEDLKRLGSHAFFDCQRLIAVFMKCPRLEHVGSHFCAQSSLAALHMSGCVGITVDDYMCASCTALSAVTGLAGLRSLGNHAFFQCSRLSALDLTQCAQLTSIGSHFCMRSGLIALDMSDCSATSIGAYMCANCPNLEAVTLPRAIVSLGDHPLPQCASLSDVTCRQAVMVGPYECSEGGLSAEHLEALFNASYDCGWRATV